MKIDLKRVIEYSNESLRNPALMKSIMMDMYPNDKLEINILLTIKDSGIIEEVAMMKSVSVPKYKMYIDRIMNEYGLSESNAIAGLNEWLSYYGIKKENEENHEPQNRESVIQEAPLENTEIHTVDGVIEDYELRVLSDDSAEIKKFLGFDEEQLTVPNKIGEFRITGIGREAYKSCKNVRKLVISDGIKYIQDSAFIGCSKLENIKFSKTLKRLGQICALTDEEKQMIMTSEYPVPYTLNDTMGVFSGSSLKEVILPNSLEQLGEAAFCKCIDLKRVVIPRGIRRIPKSAFIGCINLDDVKLSESVEEIDDAAFMACIALNKMEFPISLHRIKRKAFCMCRSLKSITLNDGIEVIEGEAFKDCSLKEVELPKTISKIEKNVFDYGITCFCYKGSYGLKYARENGYNVLNADNRNS